MGEAMTSTTRSVCRSTMPGVSRSASQPPPLDSQQLELIGRSLLVGELLRDGLEVALPERDRGIDLIVYLEGDQSGAPFIARPVQLKRSEERRVGKECRSRWSPYH